ncbi:MAG: TIGR02186 family protein [Mangrovicoccus sp.]|nr:TIGR02186 family protein [Mangrovicoccus sp.]
MSSARVFGVIFLLLALIRPAWAEEVVLGLSRSEIPITATFNGSEILVFGAIKREAPLPEGALDVIVTIAGPDAPVQVRRKERRFGIWVNASSVRIGSAPGFYAVASTRALPQILSETEDLRHQISIPLALRTVGASEDAPDVDAFVEALLRIRQEEGTYKILENAVALDEKTLFRTAVFLPPRLSEGDYRTRIFLLRDEAVIDSYETSIDVRKVGLERWLFNLAYERPLVYGIMALVVACLAGWGASAAARAVRG